MKSATLIIMFAIVFAALVAESQSAPVGAEIAKKTGEVAGKIRDAAGNALEEAAKAIARAMFAVGYVGTRVAQDAENAVQNAFKGNSQTQ